jgi:hypothetical protein
MGGLERRRLNQVGSGVYGSDVRWNFEAVSCCKVFSSWYIFNPYTGSEIRFSLSLVVNNGLDKGLQYSHSFGK